MLLDSYNIASGNLQVLGRYNSVSSTETDIERVISYTLERAEEKDDEKLDGFGLVSQPEYRRNIRRENNVTPAVINRNTPVNHSIDRLFYKPSGCQNAFECFPKDLCTLLPYLCDSRAIDNLKFTNPATIKPVHDAINVRYNPRHMNHYVLGLHANAHVKLVGGQPNAHCVTAEGLIRSDQIEFETQDDDGFLPCTYNSVNDTISCTPHRVRIRREVFGLNAGDAWRQFDLPNNGTLFQLNFDTYGYAGLTGGDGYVYSAANVNEFLRVNITGGINPAIAVVGGLNALIELYLPRPSFRKGCASNYDITPNLRHFTYFGKAEYNEAHVNNVFQNQRVVLPTSPYNTNFLIRPYIDYNNCV